MKKGKTFTVFFLGVILIVLFSASSGRCDTTIEDSTFPAEEGDVFTWNCVKSDSLFDQVGISYKNITITRIYRGSNMTVGNLYVEHGLVVDAIQGELWGPWGPGSYDIWPRNKYVVYNKSLDLLYMRVNPSLIVPIPLNLQMIAAYLETDDYYCAIEGNTLKVKNSDLSTTWDDIYVFNSNGFVISFTSYDHGRLDYQYKLEGVSSSESIPFGDWYVIFSIFASVCLAVAVKKTIHRQ